MNGDTERKRERRLYPFEKEEQKNRYEKEDRPYSGAHDGERTVENGRVMSRGKGRRDGNSAASIVRHSGKAPYGGGRRREDSHGRPGNDRRDRRHGEAFGKEKSGYEKGVDDFSSPLTLNVSRNTEIGTFLELPDGEKVLLPFSEQTRRPEEGERIQVFLFKDKGDRITATMRRPKLREGELGILSVSDVTRIGAFLDNGVPKEVLLPFSEQVSGPKPGDEVLVYLYKDKSGRTAATMRVYKHLSTASGHAEGDRVKGFVYEISDRLGVFVAVDDRYFGLIPASEVYKKYSYGDRIEARVVRVRDDGKLDLSPREKAYEAINHDAEQVLSEIRKNGGSLPYADRADAELIEKIYGMSKNQFKRALGNLYKRRLIEIDRERDRVRLL